MTENQIKIIKSELIPMIVKDVMPLMQKLLEKRLNLFADEVIKNFAEKQGEEGNASR